MKALYFASVLFAVHLSGKAPSFAESRAPAKTTAKDAHSVVTESLDTDSTRPAKKRGYIEIGDGDVVDHRGTQPRIRRLKKFNRGKKITVRPKKPPNRRERWKQEKLQRQLAFSRTETYPAFETIPIRSEPGELPAWDNEEELRKIFETSHSSEDADEDESEYESSALVEEDEEQSSETLESSVDRHRGDRPSVQTKKPTTKREHVKDGKLSTRTTHRPTESSPVRKSTPVSLKEGPPPDAGGVGGTWDDDEELRKILGEPYSSEDAEEYESSALEEDYSEEDKESADAQNSREKSETSSEDSGPLVEARNRRKEVQAGKKKPVGRRQLRWEKVRMQYVYHATDKYPTSKTEGKRSKKKRQRPGDGDGGTLDNDKELMEILGKLPPDSFGDRDENDSDAVSEDHSTEDVDDDGSSMNSQPESAGATSEPVVDQNETNKPSSKLRKNKGGSKVDYNIRNDCVEKWRPSKKKRKRLERVVESEDGEEKEVYENDKKKGGRRVPRLKTGETKKGAQWEKDLKLDDIKGPKRVRNLMKFDDPEGW